MENLPELVVAPLPSPRPSRRNSDAIMDKLDPLQWNTEDDLDPKHWNYLTFWRVKQH